jgi:hypothetical protein
MRGREQQEAEGGGRQPLERHDRVRRAAREEGASPLGREGASGERGRRQDSPHAEARHGERMRRNADERSQHAAREILPAL